MKSKNSCYTYFKITGDFDPQIITQMLGLNPQKSWFKNDLRRDGEKYGFSLWEVGREEEYHPYTEIQMEKTISILEDKIEVLNQIKGEFGVDFTLEIVPTLYARETTPALAPSMRVIDFCHATRTEIDIDLYLSK